MMSVILNYAIMSHELNRHRAHRYINSKGHICEDLKFIFLNSTKAADPVYPIALYL